MLSRRIHQLAGAFILGLTFLALPGYAHAETMRVTLDGEPSSLTRATAFHCHDLIRFELQCFTSSAERDRAVENLRGVDSTGYVIAYAAISYGGSSVVLSENYANLGTIGWNNIISSYKVFTNLTGAFYQNTTYGGGTQPYCCFTNVSYVGDFFNDTFSSFMLP
jgi:hypothetical protein